MTRRGTGQLALDLKSWGGKRARAGRKPATEKARMPHDARPMLASRHPVHATVRVLPEIGDLREVKRFRIVRASIASGRDRLGFRIVQFDVQRTHVHLIVEAKDKDVLARGMRGLQVRIAHALNALLGRAGRVFEDRYHARALKTPLEARRCLAYVLLNGRHHSSLRGIKSATLRLDPCSSAAFFDGWKGPVPLADPKDKAVADAHTWLIRVGWRQWGLISPDEIPGG